MNISQLISSLSIFQNLTQVELAEIEQIAEKQNVESNIDLIKEGGESDDFFVILKGKAEVLKIEKSEQVTRQFKLAILSTGDVCGEIAFIDHLPRSTTVRTTEPSTILRITHAAIAKAPHGKEIHRKLIHNISKASIKRLREFNYQYMDSLQTTFNLVQRRRNFGTFLIVILATLSIVTITEYIGRLLDYNIRNDWFTTLRVSLICIPSAYWIWKLGVPLKDFGISLKSWHMGVVEGSILGIILAAIAIYLESIYSDVTFKSKFMEFTHKFKGGLWLIIYPILSYLQEFLVRGVVQSSAQRFLNDTRGWYAVFVTAIIFAGGHVFRGWQFVLLAFGASVVIGLFYLRHPNLIGVTVIHMIIGFVYLPLSEKY